MTASPAFVSRGDGPPLVFLHGVGGNKETWADQLDHFAARGWRAIAWDMPGYGDSAALAAMTWPALADALLALVDRIGAERVTVVGHSMGGMVAQEFAASHAERLRALALSGTSAAFGGRDGKWQQEFVSARLAPLDAGRTMADLAQGLVAAMVGPAPDPAGLAAAIGAMARVPPATYRAAVQCLTTFDRKDNLARIAVPTLVLAAEHDRNAPPAMMERMAARIPGAVYRCLPGLGHLANLERPADFNAALDDFLTTLNGSRPR